NPNRMREEFQTAADFVPVIGDALGVDDAARAMTAGDWGTAGLNLAAVGLGAVPVAGDVAARGLKRAAQLPMDQASRMARAKEAGFYTNMPLYHGSASDFRAFDPSQGGRTSGAAPARTAVAVSLDPETANEFASLAGKASPGSSPQVYPLYHRAKRPALIELTGDEKNLEIAGALIDAFEA